MQTCAPAHFRAKAAARREIPRFNISDESERGGKRRKEIQKPWVFGGVLSPISFAVERNGAAGGTRTRRADAAAEKLRAEGEAALATMRVEEDKVQKMSFYYPVGFPEYIDTRTYALCYVGTSSTNTWVRIRYDYVGDDWVFWDHLTFLIDGQTYYRVYRYFDVERDNDHGDVWEYIDFTADDDDLELFAAIAASDETIIRFEGDAKRYDLTVSQQDKDAIRDALAAYAYLSAN